MTNRDKSLVWLYGEIKTPPFSSSARVQAGFLLRQVQQGKKLELPHSRAMPNIGRSCHELRINDVNQTWRIIYRIYSDAIVILEVFSKKTNKTPKSIIDVCKDRMKVYENEIK